MPVASNVVEFSVRGAGANASTQAIRAALEGSQDAFDVAPVHWIAVALTITAAASGMAPVSPILAMWLVLRILSPAEDLKREAPFWVISPQRLSRLFRAIVDVAGLAPTQYASK